MILNGHKTNLTMTGLRLLLERFSCSSDDASEDCAANKLFPIVWTFDDCHVDMIKIAYFFDNNSTIRFKFFVAPYLIDQYSVGNVNYVRSQLRDPYAILMSWNQIEKLVDAGHYIGLHGYDHSDFNIMTHDQIEWQHAASQELLKQRLGLVTNSFAFPFGRIDSNVVDQKKIISLSTKYFPRVYLSDNRLAPSGINGLFNRRHSEFDSTVILNLVKGGIQKLCHPGV